MAEAPGTEASAIRKFLLSRGNSAVADGFFHALIVLCALSIFGIVILIATELVLRSDLAWNKFGLSFFFKAYFDPAIRRHHVPTKFHIRKVQYDQTGLPAQQISCRSAVSICTGAYGFGKNRPPVGRSLSGTFV